MKITFTPQEDQFIKDNYLQLPIKQIAKHLQRSGCGVRGRLNKLNLVIPAALAEQRKRASYFKQGETAFNKGKKQTEYMTLKGIENSKKTRFKKGNIPFNSVPVGSETINTEGYTYIKIKEPNVWELKQRIVYEKHYKTIPDKYNIVFIDGDKFNFSIENLKMLSDKELMLSNSIRNYPPEVIPSLILMNKINKTLKQL